MTLSYLWARFSGIVASANFLLRYWIYNWMGFWFFIKNRSFRIEFLYTGFARLIVFWKFRIVDWFWIWIKHFLLCLKVIMYPNEILNDYSVQKWFMQSSFRMLTLSGYYVLMNSYGSNFYIEEKIINILLRLFRYCEWTDSHFHNGNIEFRRTFATEQLVQFLNYW